MLPIDDRLRAVARGQFSRLAQYEIEVENPLRPKEIQARIRAGETVEEIADAAGIPVERVRWFEGPVLAERGYVAQQAQTAFVRCQGDSTPGPRLGEVVAERLTEPRCRPRGRAVGLAQARGRKLAGAAGVPGRRPPAHRGVAVRPAAAARLAGRRQREPAVAAGSRAAAADRRVAGGGHGNPDQAQAGPEPARSAARADHGTGGGARPARPRTPPRRGPSLPRARPSAGRCRMPRRSRAARGCR